MQLNCWEGEGVGLVAGTCYKGEGGSESCIGGTWEIGTLVGYCTVLTLYKQIPCYSPLENKLLFICQ